ncbi:MAG TPA: DUF4040 domain-containing protein [Candidatus Acetothermia bacterium]|nr:DUF4040 domain-containing protein [Candidatus Acetothermia bacterium]
MMARMVLVALLPVVAAIALLQSRRLAAIIGMGLFSFILAAVYAFLHAPDVAITEATIGAALVTAIYILAIRRTGRLTVAADEVPGLIAREGHSISGLEYEILDGFAREQGLDLVVQFVPLRRIRWLVSHREADIGAGGLIPRQDQENELLVAPSHLETCVFVFPRRVGTPPEERAPDYAGYFSELADHGQRGMLSDVVASLDLARVLALTRCGVTMHGLKRRDEQRGYAFVFPSDREDLARDYRRHLDSLRASGALDEMVRRHFP